MQESKGLYYVVLDAHESRPHLPTLQENQELVDTDASIYMWGGAECIYSAVQDKEF